MFAAACSWPRHRRKFPLLLLLWSFILGHTTIEAAMTTYGEECTDDCAQRGFPYAWCHKRPSRNGTWIDRDYCSPSAGVTRYLEPCLGECMRRDGRPFHWCQTRKTARGDWDYCSPQSQDQCAWSAWESWSACSATCGSRSTRTQRRRMESDDGKVRHCSGEIEQSIRSCRMPECPATAAAAAPAFSCFHDVTYRNIASSQQGLGKSTCIEDKFHSLACKDFAESDSVEGCTWSSWSSWSQCSVTCGSGGTQKRSRDSSLQQECEDESVQTILCNADPCEDITQDGETTTHPAFPEQAFLGPLTSREHGVAGRVFALGQRRLRLEDFRYDSSEEAFFWIGTSGLSPSGGNGIILPYPFTGVFFDEKSPPPMALKQFNGSSVVDLTLPPNVELEDIRWFSVGNRKLESSFGDLVIAQKEFTTETTSQTGVFTDPPSTTTTVVSTSTSTNKSALVFPKLPELPRSIESSRKVIEQAVVAMKERQQEKDGQDPIPFTVIRVSSSVSQVRPEIKVEGEAAFLTPEGDKPPRKLFDSPSRQRPPFLRPATKFADIKIPVIPPSPEEENNSTFTSAAAAAARRRRPFEGLFNSKTATDNGTVATEQPHKFGESTTDQPKTTILADDDFTRIPFSNGSSLFVSTVASNSQETTSFEVTESTQRVSSISSDDFRPTQSTVEVTTTVDDTTKLSVSQSSISSDVLRGNQSVVGNTTPSTTTTSSSSIPNFTPPAAATIPSTTSASSDSAQVRGRGESRFKGNDELRKLFGNKDRKPFLDRGGSESVSSTESAERFRSTFKLEETSSTTTAASSSSSSRRPFLNRFRPPLSSKENASAAAAAAAAATADLDNHANSSIPNRFRSTRAPLVVVTTEEPLHLSSTVRITDDERLKILTGFMKEENREEKKLITLDYPEEVDGNEFDGGLKPPNEQVLEKPVVEEGRKGIVVKVPKKVAWNPVKTNDTGDDDEEEITTQSFFVTPVTIVAESSSSSSNYDPCDIADACGPNAKCTASGSEPVCSCSGGFSGIPRDGVPDPSHGCVRTPDKCNSTFSSCPKGQSCVRNFCLPQCQQDQQCSLGERCVSGNCIKICFYDAHCLAGEFCEKTNNGGGDNGNNGICLSGCRRDTNCPFGQICVDGGSGSSKRCEDGCHFNNDCNVKTACVNSTCSDPCIGFDECGTNAVCEVVSHAATCKCPSGFRELNSPYVACVPENMNLARIACLKDSDCEKGTLCKDWQCASP